MVTAKREGQEKIVTTVQTTQRIVYSDFLEREVLVDMYLPNINNRQKEVSLLLINDGQDLRTMNFAAILDSLMTGGSIKALLCIGIHCGADRMSEYGTACCADYKGRGARAGLYHQFILNELLPFITSDLHGYVFKEVSFAGFSLGGLSALDMVWNHPGKFKKAGIFSGSLWWRRHGYDDIRYNGDIDRIMHLQVQKGTHVPWLQFFFECGKLDESADRNNNGIIDSIEDTTDLMEKMKAIGYTNKQLHYMELQDGKHDIATWASAFPAFLKWGWGQSDAMYYPYR